jgi:hypothetical protein
MTGVDFFGQLRSTDVAAGSGTGSFADLVGDPHAVPANKYASDPSIKGPALNGSVGTNNFMRAYATHIQRVVQFGLKLVF